MKTTKACGKAMPSIFYFHNRNRYFIGTKTGAFLELYSVILHNYFST
jgi:hypothetical protein